MASAPEIHESETRTKRRWVRFRLRTFLLFTVVLSVFLAWIGNILIRVNQQRNVVTKIRSLGGEVYYDSTRWRTHRSETAALP